ncbi:hypothetical protein EMIT0158MI4_70116 [Burkholderia ambifaria]
MTRPHPCRAHQWRTAAGAAHACRPRRMSRRFAIGYVREPRRARRHAREEQTIRRRMRTRRESGPRVSRKS